MSIVWATDMAAAHEDKKKRKQLNWLPSTLRTTHFERTTLKNCASYAKVLFIGKMFQGSGTLLGNVTWSTVSGAPDVMAVTPPNGNFATCCTNGKGMTVFMVQASM